MNISIKADEVERIKKSAKLEALRSVEKRLEWWISTHQLSIKSLLEEAKRQMALGSSRADQKMWCEFWMEQGGLASVATILEHLRKQDIDELGG